MRAASSLKRIDSLREFREVTGMRGYFEEGPGQWDNYTGPRESPRLICCQLWRPDDPPANAPVGTVYASRLLNQAHHERYLHSTSKNLRFHRRGYEWRIPLIELIESGTPAYAVLSWADIVAHDEGRWVQDAWFDMVYPILGTWHARKGDIWAWLGPFISPQDLAAIIKQAGTGL